MNTEPVEVPGLERDAKGQWHLTEWKNRVPRKMCMMSLRPLAPEAVVTHTMGFGYATLCPECEGAWTSVGWGSESDDYVYVRHYAKERIT